MKILKMYIDSLVIHENGARKIYKIKIFNSLIYTFLNKTIQNIVL